MHKPVLTGIRGETCYYDTLIDTFDAVRWSDLSLMMTSPNLNTSLRFRTANRLIEASKGREDLPMEKESYETSSSRSSSSMTTT